MIFATAVGLAGCSKSHTRFKHPRLMSQADCAKCLQVALDSDGPDARREAVVHLSKTSHFTNEVVIRGLATIARTDRSESVRYAAVRALAKTQLPEVIEPLLEIASPPEDSTELVDNRSGPVRWAALEGLDPLVAQGRLTEEQKQKCRTQAIHLLAHDRCRDVRIAAARMLRHFPTKDTLTVLIEALEERDFGVVYHSERSLMELTGQKFDHDTAAWREWLASTENPFEDAGRLDTELHPPEKNWWERTFENTRQTLAGFRPK